MKHDVVSFKFTADSGETRASCLVCDWSSGGRAIRRATHSRRAKRHTETTGHETRVVHELLRGFETRSAALERVGVESCGAVLDELVADGLMERR